MKKLLALIAVTFLFFSTICDAGSSGFRSSSGGGFRSSGFRSSGGSGFRSSGGFSSSRSYSAPSRSYGAPSRTYSSHTTEVHHYGNSGGGNHFWNGFLGGYFGASMAQPHLAYANAPVIAGGAGGVVTEPVYVEPHWSFFDSMVTLIVIIFLFFVVAFVFRKVFKVE
jgi:hypothetical protein